MTIPQIWTPVWTSALIDHLWQSTAIAIAAWLLTIALWNKPARVRYAIWLFASIKFLIPFSALTRLGAHWARAATHDQNTQAFYFVVEEFSRPLRQAQLSLSPATPAPPTANALPIVLAIISTIWFLGSVVLLAKWVSGWCRAARMVRCAELLNDGREFNALRGAERKACVRTPIPLLRTECETEPGIFGVIRPVLLWPTGLSVRLEDAQIEAIMAHEVEHVRRRDNLTTAIHAFVEALFWFHPLIRWMGRKMNEERERACDEKVLEQSARPEAYAESILKVCAFCMEPATPCISGVSGADLKERILRIMTRPCGVALSSATKLALSVTALFIFAAPVGFGVLHGQSASSSGNASSQSSTRDLPKFDAATIKPATASGNNLMIMMKPDGISFKDIDVQRLLHGAFGVERDRIFGAPKWVQSNRYDVEAKVAPEEAPRMDKLKKAQRDAMLLSLLEERFNLKYHHETRELPMYVLVVAKGGPKLTESKPGEPMPFSDGHTPAMAPGGAPPDGAMPPPDGPPKGRNRGIIGEGMRMRPGDIESHGGSVDFLTHALSGILGRTVVDKTGLTGNYDFSLNWTPDEGMRNVLGSPEGGPPNGDAAPDAGGPTLFTALQDQLGLKLESQKTKVDVIVIDHIGLPTAN